MKLFNRVVGVTLPDDGGDLPAVKTAFNVERSNSGQANIAEISLFNLADSTRSRIQKRGLKIELTAGHKDAGTVGLIFAGFTREVYHEQRNAEVITIVKAGDGDVCYREGFINKTYAIGETIKQIVMDIQASGMPDVALGDLVGLDVLPPLKSPWTIIKPTPQALNELGRTFGFLWSILDGALEIIEVTTAVPVTTFLTHETGIIGQPRVTEAGIAFDALINPDLRPNRVVSVVTPSLMRSGDAGFYRIEYTRAQGDSHEGAFMVMCDCVRMTGVTAEPFDG